jgi:Protein required for attachment to host cells
MKPPSLFVVADRGRLLAYAIDRSARAPAARLLDSADFEGQQRLGQQVTDKAGAFPVAGSGGQANASAERMTLVAELEMRNFRRIAARITALLHEHHADAWSFAAPSEINAAIVKDLQPALRETLVQNLPRDLTRVPPGELLDHFARAKLAA